VTPQAIISDALIAKSIDLMRLSVGERIKALALLEQMRRELIAKLASDKLTELGKRRTQQLLTQSSDVIDSYYAKINAGLDKTLSGLATHESAATTKIIADTGLTATIPTQTAIASVVSDALIQGAPSKDWWAKQSEQTRFNFAQQVRQGVAQGETNQQIISRVSAIMDVRRRDAASLVQTSVQTIANDSRLATFRLNSDVVKGVRQLSTLDGHTSDICIARSGAEWDLDGNPINGNDLPFENPPIHFGCRSVLVPITKTFRELGLDIPEVPQGTRASDEGQIKASTTFTEFLSGKSKEYQDDLLGKGRAELWRDGKITLRDLLDQRGRPLTLKQLQDKHG
jgi:SPP1 gp7 family putative phage head morphogenesis protein